MAGRFLPPLKIPSLPRSAPSPTCALSLSLSPVISSNINSFSSRASRLSFSRSSSCWILAPSSSLSAGGEGKGGGMHGVHGAWHIVVQLLSSSCWFLAPSSSLSAQGGEHGGKGG